MILNCGYDVPGMELDNRAYEQRCGLTGSPKPMPALRVRARWCPINRTKHLETFVGRPLTQDMAVRRSKPRQLYPVHTAPTGFGGPLVAGAIPRLPVSACNQLSGLVIRVVRDQVMAQVETQVGPRRIVSLMTAEAVEETRGA